jgi:anaerobic magnesium-protoporphyrin IX monomethyl ester cyclase
MKVALVNPQWQFEGSTYFGCTSPHLPLELGYCRSLLEQDGHETLLIDAPLLSASNADVANEVAAFAPEITVVTTAPSYLFWRCAPPELSIPRQFLDYLGTRGGARVAVGPHGSVTPRTTLRKLKADIVVRGECEEAVLELATHSAADVSGIAIRTGDDVAITGAPRSARFVDTPALAWEEHFIRRHSHHHHRFDRAPHGSGAEVEASRGCPYSCTFCAKIDFRDRYRRRELAPLLDEIDRLIAQGVTYLYFIDEIFLPNRPLLEALVARRIEFGIQTRIDLWKPDMLSLLGEAGCVSVEAGVESLTEEGRDALGKKCRLTTDELAALLIKARQNIPFVQANLISMAGDEADLVARWREQLQSAGVWANDPVPLYPYPSSPDYRRLFGEPDELAWERAHAYYLDQFSRFSDIQDEHPLPLEELEATCR